MTIIEPAHPLRIDTAAKSSLGKAVAPGPSDPIQAKPRRVLTQDIEEIEAFERRMELLEKMNEEQIDLDEAADRAEFNKNIARMLAVSVFCAAVLIGADFIWPFETF